MYKKVGGGGGGGGGGGDFWRGTANIGLFSHFHRLPGPRVNLTNTLHQKYVVLFNIFKFSFTANSKPISINFRVTCHFIRVLIGLKS